MFFSTFAQTSPNIPKPNRSNFPEFYVVDGDTIGVILTINQAIKLDNDTDLLELLKKKEIQSDSLIDVYVTVIDEFGKKVALLEEKNRTYESIIIQKDELITNLKNQIENYKEQIRIADEQLRLQEEIIKNQNKMLKKRVLSRNIFISTTVIGTVGGFLLGFLAF